MKLRRVLATILAAALVVPVLAGCGGGGKEASSEGGGSDSGVLDVKIWDATQQEGIQTICDEWSETSGIEAKVEVVTWDDYWTLLEAGASGGTMPDVFWMHSNNIQKYMDAGLLLNLNDYIEGDENIDMANY